MSRDSSDALEDLRYRREKAHMGGGIKRQESIRASGRGTARAEFVISWTKIHSWKLTPSSPTEHPTMECSCMRLLETA